MFGHNDQQQPDTTLPSPAPDGDLADDSQATATAPQVDSGTSNDFPDDVSAPSVPPTVTKPDSTDAGLADNTTGVIDDGAASTDVPADVPATAPAPVAPANTDQLLDIKQQALQQLTPLIGHLDQSPEEKFRTTMMMIQAADNHELLSTAYEAAQQIEDEKVRAQALLDIVNEINYFIHNNSTNNSADS